MLVTIVSAVATSVWCFIEWCAQRGLGRGENRQDAVDVPNKDPDFDRNFVVWTISDDPPIKLGASTWKAESPSPDDFRDQHSCS